MTRLPYPAAPSEHVAHVLGRLPPLNIFRMVANADSAFVPWLRFGGASSLRIIGSSPRDDWTKGRWLGVATVIARSE